MREHRHVVYECLNAAGKTTPGQRSVLLDTFSGLHHSDSPRYKELGSYALLGTLLNIKSLITKHRATFSLDGLPNADATGRGASRLCTGY